MPEGHDTTIKVSNIMSFVLDTQILKQSVLKPASPGITLRGDITRIFRCDHALKQLVHGFSSFHFDMALLVLNAVFVRYSSHVKFLERCITEQVIPKGFQMKWRLTTDFYQDINEKCEKVKRDASLQLMDLTLSMCQRKT